MHLEAIVAEYDGNFKDLLKRYSDNFVPVVSGRAVVQKYALICKENSDIYICMISNCTDPEIRQRDYNIMLSVHGPRKEKVQELIADMIKKFGIPTKPAPEEVKKPFELAFKLHEQMQKYRTPFGFYPGGGVNYN